MTNALDYIHFEKDFYPFWEYLALNEDCTPEQVRHAWELVEEKEKKDPHYIFAFKCLSDPFFSHYYKQCRSISALYDAGFFIDGYTNSVPYALNMYTTPLHKIHNNMHPSSNNVVLVSTGGFSPVHEGHIKMMETARNYLVDLGYNVVGGFLSPSHDNYVSQKHGGTAAMNAEERIFLAEKSLFEHPWLSVDRWEALYTKYSVNFTDVIVRLQMYMEKYMKGQPVPKVCFVYGSDNVAFGHAFSQGTNMAVCVQRQVNKPSIPSYPNTHFVQSQDTFGYSSTEVRNGDKNQLPEAIRNDYRQPKKPQQEKQVYIVRNDLRQALQRLGYTLPPELEKDTLEQTRLLIERYVPDVQVVFVDVRDQQTMAEKILETKSLPSLSLDVYFEGQARVELSRQFNLADAQIYSKNLVQRPNSPSINKQVSAIVPGKYVLVEDDSVSGTTIKFVKDLLPNVHIEDIVLLSEMTGTPNKDVYDVMDMRDIIFGLPDGGLVVEYNNELCRAPYAFPYVSPHTRSSIPLGKQMSFSKDLWALNAAFYSRLNENIGLKDMSQSFANLMCRMRFSMEQTMSAIALEHSEGLGEVGYDGT